MDEEDFRFKARPRPKPKPEGLAKKPRLLDTIRRLILTTHDDFLIKQDLAHKLQALPHHVGLCLAELARQGLVTFERSVPGSEECVSICGANVHWRDGEWWDRLPRTSIPKPRRGRKYRDTRTMASKRELEKYARKNPPQKASWNGKANFIIRGTPAFKRAAKAAGLPEDPLADWVCSKPECAKVLKYTDDYCRKCMTPRYPRPEPQPVGSEKQGPVCKRCGGEMRIRMKGGKKTFDHGLRKCNLSMVAKIMSD